MNKNVKIIIRILAVLCLLSLILPFVLTAKAADTSRYGYSLLKNDTQRTAYQYLADGIGAGEPTISFQLPTATQETLQDVIDALGFVATDFPEYFWFTGGGNVGASGNDVNGYTITVTPSTYTINGQPADKNAISNAKAAFNAVIDEAMSKIPAGASDYQKSEILHDFVDDKTVYEQTGDHQSAYGALVLGKAVCAGYARAYQVLMNKAGIKCWYVEGTSPNPNNQGGDPERHAWNLVFLDGACYYTDVTWDDHRPANFHHYLNLSLEQISTDHFPDHPEYLPASCGHNTYTYFKMNAGEGKGVCDMTGSESGADIAKYFVLKSLNGDQAEYFCRVHYHGGDFGTWLSNNGLSLADALDLTGSIGFQEEYMGIEYQMTVTGTVKSPVTPPQETQPVTTPPVTNPTTTQPVQTQPSQTQPVQTTSPATTPATTPETTTPAGNEGQTATTHPSTAPATSVPASTQPAGTTSASGSTNGTTAPVTDSEQEPSGGNAVLIVVIVAAVLLAGGGAAVYFLKFYKKAE